MGTATLGSVFGILNLLGFIMKFVEGRFKIYKMQLEKEKKIEGIIANRKFLKRVIRMFKNNEEAMYSERS